MVEGMGPLGVEGVFRRSCEITMALIRQHRDIFLSVIRPFVFDPLVEWDAPSGQSKSTAASRKPFKSTSKQITAFLNHYRVVYLSVCAKSILRPCPLRFLFDLLSENPYSHVPTGYKIFTCGASVASNIPLGFIGSLYMSVYNNIFMKRSLMKLGEFCSIKFR